MEPVQGAGPHIGQEPVVATAPVTVEHGQERSVLAGVIGSG